jgi:hypothetical protein
VPHHRRCWGVEHRAGYPKARVGEHKLIVFRREGQADERPDREKVAEDDKQTASVCVKVSAGEEGAGEGEGKLDRGDPPEVSGRFREAIGRQLRTYAT